MLKWQILYFDEEHLNITQVLEVLFLVKKKGERYKCDICGLVVLVEDDCGCNDCDIVCCAAPMKLVEKEKAKPKAKPKPAKTKPKK